MLRQMIWLFAAAATLALVAAAPAGADKPIRERAPFGEGFTYAAGDPCAFPLSVSAVEDKAYDTVFFDNEGIFLRVHVAGRVVLQFTNAVTGESLVVNVSGP